MVSMIFGTSKSVEFAPKLRLADRRGLNLYRIRMAGLLASLVLFVCSGLVAGPLHRSETRLYVNYSAKPDPRDLAAFDLCILDPDSAVDLSRGHEMGRQFLAYLSLIELKPQTPAAKAAGERKIPLLGHNEIWDTDLADASDPEWERLLIDALAKSAASKGYDGFFLDTLESVALIRKTAPEKAAACQDSLVRIIRKLRNRYPDKKIVLNRGFDLLDQVSAEISGVLIESVYQSFDRATGQYHAVDIRGSEWLEGRIRRIRALGLPVYAVDYVDPGQPDVAKTTADQLAKLGCIPLVTTPDLNGAVLAPVCETARRISVLFGWDSKFADRPPAARNGTIVAQHLQTPLEWLGFELDYHDVGTEPLPVVSPLSHAGVILDEQLMLRPDQELAAAAWLVSLKSRGIPVLFVGDMPFSLEETRLKLAEALGIDGTMRRITGVQRPSIRRLDGAVMNGEAALIPSSMDFRDLAAPASADVFLAINGEDREGDEWRFDPVFLASWGGMWLRPYLSLDASSDNRAYLGDRWRFLAQWLRSAKPFPVPDTTTRDGRRIFFSQVDGEGFLSPAHFPGHPSCAEVVRDEILRHHRLPTTVSIKENDPVEQNAAAALDGDQVLRQRFLAKSIFSMPHVQSGVPLLSDSCRCRCAGGGRESLFGGFENVLNEFARWDKPRRVAPVNVHYHFASAARPSSRQALEKIFDWCEKQPLHPITASQYVRLVGDARNTKILEIGPGHWLISNTGMLRTLRLPAAAGIPDLVRCRSICGYKIEGDVIYIHTTGRTATELVMRSPDAPPDLHLHLVESSADVEFHELTPHQAIFEVAGWDTVEMTFSGLPPGASIAISQNRDAGRLQADPDGLLKLSLPPRATITLTVLPSTHVVSR